MRSMKLTNNLNHEIEVQWGVDPLAAMPDEAEVSQWVSETLAQQSAPRCELAIRIVSIEEIQSLNDKYRHKPVPTNVLSFPMDAGLEDDLLLLGDIAICQDIVAEEAKVQGKPLKSHFAHMVVHGVLHLLGFDHLEDDEAEEMEQIEIGILRTIGVSNPYVSEARTDAVNAEGLTSDNSGVPR